MQQYEPQDIKRRPDGSIDTGHYMMICRQKRSEQAQKLVKSALPKRKHFLFQVWPLWASKT